MAAPLGLLLPMGAVCTGTVLLCPASEMTPPTQDKKNQCFEHASVRGGSGWCCRRALQSLELQKGVAQTWSWCSLCSAPPDISHRCSHCCLHPSCKAVQCPSELCAKWEHSSREAAKAQEWKPCNKSQEIGFYWFAGGLFFFFTL